MKASTAARAILHEIMNLQVIEDLEFIADRAKEVLRLRRDTVVSSDLSEHDVEELHEVASAIFHDPDIEFTSPEAAHIAAWLLTTEASSDEFASRQITFKLGKLRKVANITNTMESLIDKGFIATTEDSPEEQKHKRFYLTPDGNEEAHKLINEKSGKILKMVG